jgi:hypothetical protein
VLVNIPQFIRFGISRLEEGKRISKKATFWRAVKEWMKIFDFLPGMNIFCWEETGETLALAIRTGTIPLIRCSNQWRRKNGMKIFQIQFENGLA